MKTAFIVQARMGSTRLPQKVLRPFYEGKCILELLISKLNQIANTKIIIATSLNAENNIIEQFCKEHSVICFRGEENDVLKRFVDAANAYGIDHIIRVCSDNPFLELNSIKKLVEVINKTDAEYIGFHVNNSPAIKTHFGFWTEYVTLNTLKKIRDLTDEPLYHEHVTNYIYSHSEQFNIVWIMNAGNSVKNLPIRLTIDTESDFVNAQKIYSYFAHSGIQLTIPHIVDYLSNHPTIIYKMKTEITKNTK